MTIPFITQHFFFFHRRPVPMCAAKVADLSARLELDLSGLGRISAVLGHFHAGSNEVHGPRGQSCSVWKGRWSSLYERGTSLAGEIHILILILTAPSPTLSLTLDVSRYFKTMSLVSVSLSPKMIQIVGVSPKSLLLKVLRSLIWF